MSCERDYHWMLLCFLVHAGECGHCMAVATTHGSPMNAE